MLASNLNPIGRILQTNACKYNLKLFNYIFLLLKNRMLRNCLESEDSKMLVWILSLFLPAFPPFSLPPTLFLVTYISCMYMCVYGVSSLPSQCINVISTSIIDKASTKRVETCIHAILNIIYILFSFSYVFFTRNAIDIYSNARERKSKNRKVQISKTNILCYFTTAPKLYEYSVCAWFSNIRQNKSVLCWVWPAKPVIT